MGARLTRRFEKASVFAIRAHDGQVRKGTRVPYACHPLGVASIVLEHGGDEDQAIAALLHDVIEDCGVKESDIRKRFGARVARIVSDCTDHFGGPGVEKAPWHTRKKTYLVRLDRATRDTLIVSMADKVHNARALSRDLEHEGSRAWRRFNAGPTDIAWYYEALVLVFRRRASVRLKPLLGELARLSKNISESARQI